MLREIALYRNIAIKQFIFIPRRKMINFSFKFILMKTLQKTLFLLLGLYSPVTISQNIYFPPVVGNNWDTLSPQSLGWCQEKIDTMYNYLEENNSKAFILLKDGKIVLEKILVLSVRIVPGTGLLQEKQLPHL